MSTVLLKIYAAFWPASEACFEAVREAGRGALGNEEDWIFWEGDLLRLSFEGIYFPREDVLEALATCLPPQAQGKLDVLDMEGWTLTRYLRAAEHTDGFTSSKRSLNHVLDYAGH